VYIQTTTTFDVGKKHQARPLREDVLRDDILLKLPEMSLASTVSRYAHKSEVETIICKRRQYTIRYTCNTTYAVFLLCAGLTGLNSMDMNTTTPVFYTLGFKAMTCHNFVR
jgi:hypothetical protein